MKTPQKKSKNVQTVNPKDAYKDDWEVSQVYRRALKEEAEKRGIAFVDPIQDEEDVDDMDDSSLHMERNKFNDASTPMTKPNSRNKN